MTLRKIWRAGVAAAGSLLLWLGVARAAEKPAAADPTTLPTTIDLKFVELKEDPSFSWGSILDATGKLQRPFATKSGRLMLQVTGDKLRVDSNGDGTIDDKDAPAIELKEVLLTTRPATPPPLMRVKVAVSFGGKMVDYPLIIQSQKIGDSQRLLMVGAAAVVEGQFGRHTIRILDTNSDGRFGVGDSVSVAPAGETAIRGVQQVPWSRMVAVDRKLYGMEMVGGGAQLKLTPYTGPVAEVRLQYEKSLREVRATLEEVFGAQVNACVGDQPGVFVPGKYRLSMVYIQNGTEDRPGFMYALNGSAALLELKAGENVVKVGPPLKLTFTAVRDGSTLEITGVQIPGQAGESYRVNVEKEQGEQFAIFIKSGAKEQKLGDLEFG